MPEQVAVQGLFCEYFQVHFGWHLLYLLHGDQSPQFVQSLWSLYIRGLPNVRCYGHSHVTAMCPMHEASTKRLLARSNSRSIVMFNFMSVHEIRGLSVLSWWIISCSSKIHSWWSCGGWSSGASIAGCYHFTTYSLITYMFSIWRKHDGRFFPLLWLLGERGHINFHHVS